MENTSVNKKKPSNETELSPIVLGILAHVDSGKTTLAESLLYLTGSIRKAGRVDHGDAFLDTYELERSRGITIFAKQAELKIGKRPVTLLDTPGHVDFSAEMERTLQVLDYAVLVISGADGVQGHVMTLWRLLKQYRIPVFLFINKMDQEGTDREALLKELQARLDEHCLAFENPGEESQEFLEGLAMCGENALEEYLETGDIEQQERVKLIQERNVFPCYFGSALKLTGVDGFIRGLEAYLRPRQYGDEFGARVYKISRDSQGTRLTWMKVTGGSLKVKQVLEGSWINSEGQQEIWKEKADQIRIYSGAGYELAQEAPAGTVCAVTGLEKTCSGQGLGAEESGALPLLEPVLTYRIILPPECDVHVMYKKLGQLEEEIPELHLVWSEASQEIHVQVMGEVQMEILQSMILERFGTKVSFDSGSIVYKETIAGMVEGVGHYEPLRHYAEVHLLLEPGERGSGMQFASACSTDDLDLNWQRLVLTHLEEKQHRGVLTGSEITDMKITLAAGKAHLKHTEGGDFRQATYRAVRQGLMKAESILLEPVYEYRLEIPPETVGRAISDIQRMQGSFAGPEQEGDMAVLTGSAPVAAMRDYQREVTAYTRGCGRLFCSLKGYEPCREPEKVIEAAGYDPEGDMENPTGSVFCVHGAGFVVPWDQVEDYMHLEPVLKPAQKSERGAEDFSEKAARAGGKGYGASLQDDAELLEIFQRTYGKAGQERRGWNRSRNEGTGTSGLQVRDYGSGRDKKPEESYLLVDGYNIIFAWEDLKELAQVSLEGARGKLMDILCNYQGYRKMTLILVFDAYKVEGNVGEVMKYHNIHVIYTKEAETADQYIEKTVHRMGGRYDVTVATSDAAEQMIIWGQGARRLSARGLRREIREACQEIQENYLQTNPGAKHYLFENLGDDMAALMEEVRLGKKKL
ncbi:MAG TPA: TetM/TetW/TetO/TetS family tetracycline resistance ribosomal protection protein [Candidatus Merdiplasma excrementigallinarum]|uniref:TetM/TetW/TetO/TetS family tetracycline resistance ribosomal protection protein n=1 Tax=Candidatus Merdiplasma excrementigallinarum TaxID=2840864 RepID=A0A9D1T7J1_9FIRM|nr:TetM/TetW/TetO/TetS family tetracycline resistance ribosomal protection protein [Candidatus Merdiplasma excrementigallinarum]